MQQGSTREAHNLSHALQLRDSVWVGGGAEVDEAKVPCQLGRGEVRPLVGLHLQVAALGPSPADSSPETLTHTSYRGRMCCKVYGSRLGGAGPSSMCVGIGACAYVKGNRASTGWGGWHLVLPHVDLSHAVRLLRLGDRGARGWRACSQPPRCSCSSYDMHMADTDLDRHASGLAQVRRTDSGGDSLLPATLTSRTVPAKSGARAVAQGLGEVTAAC